MKTSFVTDTATMCVFDLYALRHRLVDDVDWWSIQNEELSEVNQGNVAFVSLNDDGEYEVIVANELLDSDCEVNIRCPSGQVFIGAGEEVTSDGLEPECVRGGVFFNIPAGSYRVALKRLDSRKICLAFKVCESAPINAFKESLQV